jgi:hypothetical protein
MNLHSSWIVGFVDGEGCFHIGISRDPSMACGYQVLPEFTVTQQQRDLKVLHALKAFFGCGVVRVNHGDRWCYRVRGQSHLRDRILPFFEKHPLLSSKRIDFQKFRRVVLMMEKSMHLHPEGLLEIQRIQRQMHQKKQQDTSV